MNIVELITKKRNGGELTKEEIAFIVTGYTEGNLPDYQLSAFLMAVFFQSMTAQETSNLTQQMIASGDCLHIDRKTVDKHSTGGVGDKVSIILAPMVAACGVAVPMMSGTALGHTGGTLDKLGSILGYRTQLTEQEAQKLIATNNYCMMGQTERMVPADKKLYALRDVTGTVESIPLIVASILSKKFAEGADALVMDVKCGSGAFLKTKEEALRLATALRNTGNELDREVVAVISNMQSPLGYMVGNFLEIEEVVHCLQGEINGRRLSTDSRSADLMELTLRLGSWMLVLGEKARNLEEGKKLCQESIDSGGAWNYFLNNVHAQGGDSKALCESIGKRRPDAHKDILAPADGYVSIDAYKVAIAAQHLGAGRKQLGDSILPDVGVELLYKHGQKVSQNAAVLRLWYDESKRDIFQSITWAEKALNIGDSPTETTMILQELS